MLDRLRRITDLFVEGREIPLGLDSDGVPVVVWVNKPNSFEVEEARRDGLAARSDRILALKMPHNADLVNITDQMEGWSKDQLVDARVAQDGDDMWMAAVNDTNADPQWREHLDWMRRMPAILDDAGAPEDDERRERLSKLNASYLDEISTRLAKKQTEKGRDLKDLSVSELRESYLENWRARVALDDYMREKRITELFYALRDCQATKPDPLKAWDHSKCDHSKALLGDRNQVRKLPEKFIAKAVSALDDMEIGQREAGNSGAPVSSSASSESPSAEAASTPSTQAGTSGDAAMT